MKCLVCGKEEGSISFTNGVCQECIISHAQTQLNQGWICPKCKTALSPNIYSCPFCKPSTTTEGGMTFQGKTILMEGTK